MCMKKLTDLEMLLREIIYMAIKTQDMVRSELRAQQASFAKTHSFSSEIAASEMEMRMESMIEAVEHLREADKQLMKAGDRLRHIVT